MRVEVVESIAERTRAEAKPADEGSVKLALQSFQSAMQGDASFFDSRRTGELELAAGEDGRAICSGGFLLSFRGKEFGSNRGIHFQLIQKLFELLKNAGSAEMLAARLYLITEKQDEVVEGGFALRVELEAVGDSNEQATLRCVGDWAWRICSRLCFSLRGIFGKRFRRRAAEDVSVRAAEAEELFRRRMHTRRAGCPGLSFVSRRA